MAKLLKDPGRATIADTNLAIVVVVAAAGDFTLNQHQVLAGLPVRIEHNILLERLFGGSDARENIEPAVVAVGRGFNAGLPESPLKIGIVDAVI